MKDDLFMRTGASRGPGGGGGVLSFGGVPAAKPVAGGVGDRPVGVGVTSVLEAQSLNDNNNNNKLSKTSQKSSKIVEIF